MKTYSTEAGAAETTCTGFRRPFRVLQNLQFFQNFSMSSKVSASSPLKTSTGRTKKVESNTQPKESQTKYRSANLAARKTLSDRISTKTTANKISVQSKKQDDAQSKISESSDGSITSVGSLTSSPKWSHIKKKFESDESVSSSKSSKSTTSEPKKSNQSNRTTKNTSSGNAENVSFIHRNKYLSAKRDADKKNDSTVNKSDISMSSRLNNDKLRLGASSVKNETFKSGARCVSPKLSSANTPAINSSALHSSNLSKYASGSIDGGLKTSHSSKTSSSESVKNETFKSTARCASPKPSSANTPAVNSSALHSNNLSKYASGSIDGGLKTSHSNKTSSSESVKNEAFKSTARCASPKPSSTNTPAVNSSALHSNNLSKYSSGNVNGGLKTSHSSKTSSSESVKNETVKSTARCVSPKPISTNTSALHSSSSSKYTSGSKTSYSAKTGSSESIKNSRSNSPKTVSCSSPTLKSSYSKFSSSSSAADKPVNSLSKCLVGTTRDSAIKSTHSASISNSTVASKKNVQDSKENSFREKEKFEDKPILAFNYTSQQSEKSSGYKPLNKLSGSASEKSLSTPSSSLRVNKNSRVRPNSTNYSSIDKTFLSENVEKIKDLTRNSQSESKTIWIKDSAGNWVKKIDADAKNVNNNKAVSNSKVASLRSKFMEPSKEGNIPLTKSSTTSSVPSNSVLNNRPLAKSSTLNNICDKVFIDVLSKKVTSVNSNIDKKDSVKDTAVSSQLNSSVNDKKESRDSKNDNNLKLNIVQRAVLSYEGSLALLSPETQKRLKLVSEKVQAQTDDDKILRAKTKNNVLNHSKNSSEATSSNSSKKSNEQKSLGEPVLPVRNFLNRYQQVNKNISPKNPNKLSEENIKNKITAKQNEARSSFLSDISSTLNKKETPNSVASEKNLPKKSDSSLNNKSVTKLTMNFELPNGQIDVKSNNQENEYVLQPNSSFLWRRSEIAPSEQSKSSTASSASLTSSDYRNYYDIENYYSSLELEIEKRSENSEEPIYIDSQESNNSSENNYASSISSNYQNMCRGRLQNGSHDEWTDLSDDDYRKNSVSSNQSSTLKRRKNKRFSSYRDSSSVFTKSQEQRRQPLNDTISFTDSSDTLINDEIGNESTFDMSDVNHFYEPVYESLGNYLLNQEEDNEENCLSPDEPENGDIMECSLTSLESTESNNQEKEALKSCKDSDKNIASKKSSNKISQLKRHLSWTKNDIRFELSSKFNKIKIKKNGNNSTEIGLKMQESENPNTSPKKKTFIKCILRQKSASSIPLKRSPSPKKESALFYVHLTMGREKQRPFSDSAVAAEVSKDDSEGVLKSRKQSDSAVNFSTAARYNQHNSRSRKFTSGHTIQRPKTPPPLPPVQAAVNNKNAGTELSDGKRKESTSTLVSETNDVDSTFYTLLDEEYISAANLKPNPPYENDILKLIHDTNKSRTFISTSVEKLDDSDASSNRNSNASSRRVSNDLNLPLRQSFPSENLKSPFEEEPMYQFYQKDVQQRATLWYSVDGSESEFEDDVLSRLSDPEYQSPKRPVLQSQLSAMDLVQGGEGGQRRLWCEVPEVIESGILKTIAPNDRKIQEAMFEVITSEASYLKSLNFLIEHFVQCPEFSGEFSEKHILDKRERHVLFSDIQPVRDVSSSLLADLEKRWMKYIVLSDICDILYHHASKYFSVYVKYCSNQLYQERLLRALKEKRPEFIAVLKRLESNPVCQGLDMPSFLMLPMQRITRLPLLIDAIFRRLSTDSPIYESCKIALATVNKIVAECNEGACKMQRMEEMLLISQQIDFKACKGLGLLSASRYLVKKGELVQLLMDNSSRRTFGRSSRWCKIQLYLFLFTDLLVVTRRKSDDNYSVVDYCPRNMLQVMPVDENTPPLPMRLPSSYRNVFQLIMLNNRDGKTIEMLLSCLLESDRTRWMSAVRPAKSENPDEKIYEEWDCPQVQCTHAYNAQQPDELSLEEADVVNVFKKMSDGWFEGERIRDGMRGWFPSSHTVEIINSHVRARNLHQRYRLLMLSQTYLEEQQKAQAQQAKK